MPCQMKSFRFDRIWAFFSDSDSDRIWAFFSDSDRNDMYSLSDPKPIRKTTCCS